MSESRAVDLGSAEWQAEAPGIRSRAVAAAGSRWAIVEYGAGVARAEWCTDGHRGYVLEGAIEYEFDDGRPPLSLRQGQGFVLAAGAGHRGRNVADGPTRLFLIDDPS